MPTTITNEQRVGLYELVRNHIGPAQLLRLARIDGDAPLGYLVAGIAASTIGTEAGLLAGALVLLLTTTGWMAVKSMTSRRLSFVYPAGNVKRCLRSSERCPPFSPRVSPASTARRSSCLRNRQSRLRQERRDASGSRGE